MEIVVVKIFQYLVNDITKNQLRFFGRLGNIVDIDQLVFQRALIIGFDRAGRQNGMFRYRR